MSSPGTTKIEIGPRPARAALERFMTDLVEQYPDEQKRLDLLWVKSTMLDRTLIRDDLLPRVEGVLELDWLRANNAKIAVKSSLPQFHDGLIRIQVLDRETRGRWQWWLDN